MIKKYGEDVSMIGFCFFPFPSGFCDVSSLHFIERRIAKFSVWAVGIYSWIIITIFFCLLCKVSKQGIFFYLAICGFIAVLMVINPFISSDGKEAIREILSKAKNPFILKNFLSFIGQISTKIVGFSCMSNLLPFTILAAKMIKENYPDKIVVLGGVGPSPVAHHIIKEFPFIDIVVDGEGEEVIIEIMEGNQNQVLQGKRIVDIDSLPMPAYHLINFKDYDAAPSIITSRGCPYNCAFCTEGSIFGRGVRFRDIDLVIEEMKYVYEQSGRTLFLIQDDNFTLNKSRILNFCNKIKRIKLDLKWKCFGRINLMDKEIMEKMAGAGCVQIRYGIESGSNKILEKIRKRFTIEEAYKIVSESVKYFPSVHTSFIWGYPFETIEDLFETLKQMKKFEEAGATAYLFQLSPLPRSEIYEKYKGELDFFPELYSNFNAAGCEQWEENGCKIHKTSRYIYDFIKKYPHIFPGFYQYDLKNNITPKYKFIQKYYGSPLRKKLRNEYDL